MHQLLARPAPAFVSPEEIFREYAYFSGYSTAWVEHARQYVEMIRKRRDLGSDDFVVELASNDGYLLRHFLGTGIPILGIDPAENVARAAEEGGVPTLVEFFGRETAERLADEGRQASLVVGNNVLAQVPDLNDFVGGVKILLRNTGTATFEFPHLLRLLDGLQYDTIYHEHFSYFSFGTIVEIVRSHELEVYDVDELWTHGGSLRVYAQHADGPQRSTVTRTSTASTRRAPTSRFIRPSELPRRPDYILVLPWNLIDEIAAQLSYIAEWGGKLIVPIPLATVLEPGAERDDRLVAAGRAA